MALLPTAYLNGDYLPAADTRLHVTDLAILRGYGVFDFFRYAERRPIFLQDHLDRFYRSAAALGLHPGPEPEALAEVVRRLIDRNEVAAGGIRFVLTGGYSVDGYTPADPNLIALAYTFTPPPPELYERGCRVLLHPYRRQLPRAKTIDYVEGIRIQEKLRAAGADYVLYVDHDDRVLESDRSNFMIVENDVLITPEDDLLLGVTRKRLLQLAAELGIDHRTEPVSVERLGAAPEAIICSSTKGGLPITVIDDRPVGDGTPGPVTRRLMAAWPDYVRRSD